MKKLISSTMALSAIIVLGACSTDDSVDEQQALNTQQAQAINFDTYLGQSATSRGAILAGEHPSSGIYAMYTKGGKYDPKSSDTKDKTNFEANFMNNIELKYKQVSYQDAWLYQPLRYWPMTSSEYVSFLAYAPYNKDTKLYTKTETTSEETTTSTFAENGNNPLYYKYTLADKASDTYDFLWHRLESRNMQFYWDKDNNKWITPSNKDLLKQFNGTNSPYKVQMRLDHATARIAYVVTAPALLHEDNYVTHGDNETVKSGAKITVNKVMLVGAKDANATTPTGAFTSEGYFDISQTLTKASQTQSSPNVKWEGLSTTKKAYSFEKNDFVSGTYNSSARVQPNSKMWTPTTNATNVIQGSWEGNDVDDIAVNDIGTPSNGYLFIIPQDFSDKDATDKLYCYINYTVTYDEGTTGEVKDNGITYEGYGQVTQNFIGGHAYVINIELGKTDGGSNSKPQTDLNAIFLHSYVESWGGENSAGIQVNGTQTNY